ncbi:hypothetical protein NC652_029061 [Populus alba x Populus x berolinensis]|nr:hypothetical protein NC652_029061 [Populus alba x Populus x berolinensis]
MGKKKQLSGSLSHGRLQARSLSEKLKPVGFIHFKTSQAGYFAAIVRLIPFMHGGYLNATPLPPNTTSS